eukprot:769109-Prymnesium_polylepis.2
MAVAWRAVHSARGGARHAHSRSLKKSSATTLHGHGCGTHVTASTCEGAPGSDGGAAACPARRTKLAVRSRTHSGVRPTRWRNESAGSSCRKTAAAGGAW